MDLDGSKEFFCGQCEEAFTCEEVRDTLAAMTGAWAKIIVWAESYPADDTSE